MQRREQRRLVGLLLAMGLVVVALPWMANPANWNWIERMSQRGEAATAPDTSMAPPASELAAETVLVRVEEEPRAAPRDGAEGNWREIDPEVWKEVRDDVAFRSEELPLFWDLMAGLSREKPSDLAREAEEVTFAQLFQLPQEYRGKLIEVRGRARRAVRVRAAANDAGIGSYHQLWMQTSDNPSSPLVVFAAELPPGFPEGMEISTEELTIPGVFFKRWPYNAQDGLRTAPAMVAGSFDWSPPAPGALAQRQAAAEGPSIWQGVAWGGVICAVVVGYVWWRTRREPDLRVPEKLPEELDQRLREELP